MFTDRYIKVPVNLYDTKKADMVGFNESTRGEQTFMSISPFEISHYRPSVDDDDELKETLIHMKSGDNFVVAMRVEDFEQLLNNHFGV